MKFVASGFSPLIVFSFVTVDGFVVGSSLGLYIRSFFLCGFHGSCAGLIGCPDDGLIDPESRLDSIACCLDN